MDEADVKSVQFGQERGAQALPKQFVVDTKQQTRPTSFKFVQTVWFPGTAPAQEAVQNCHSFGRRAAPCARCDAGFVLEC